MKDPIFTKEAVLNVLAGQDEAEKKAEALLSLYNEDLNGLKINRDDIRKEKEQLMAENEELKRSGAKAAEDNAKLQKQLDASAPDEIKKAYEQKQTELESSYKGILAERDGSIKSLTEQLETARKSEHSLKCMQDFAKATAGFDIEPTSREYLYSAIYGADGSAFTERDLGNGLQLINKDGKTGEGAVRAFLSTDFGKKFLKNTSSGGGAGTGDSKKSGSGANPFAKETFNLTEQARLLKENPDLYKQMRTAAGA